MLRIRTLTQRVLVLFILFLKKESEKSNEALLRNQNFDTQEALFLCWYVPQGVVPRETPDVRSPQGPCCRHCVLSLSQYHTTICFYGVSWKV